MNKSNFYDNEKYDSRCSFVLAFNICLVMFQFFEQLPLFSEFNKFDDEKP